MSVLIHPTVEPVIDPFSVTQVEYEDVTCAGHQVRCAIVHLANEAMAIGIGEEDADALKDAMNTVARERANVNASSNTTSVLH